MKPTKISNRNVMFSEPMGDVYDLNIGLILGNQYNYVIDTGLGSGSVMPVIKYLGHDAKPVIIINTHSHYDHIWGNWVFKDNLIIAHAKCRELTDKHWEETINEFSHSIDGKVHKCLPNVTIENSICFPDDGIRIFYSPGHSIDCISIYDEVDKVLYAGDNIGDTEDVIVPYIETDLETFKKLIELYKKFDFNICISGHNKPQKQDIICRMEAALEDCWSRQVCENGMPV